MATEKCAHPLFSDWEKIRDNYRKWWAGELDRPLISVSLSGRDPGRPEPELPSHGFAAFYDEDVPAEAIADRWLYNLECRYFPADSFPAIWPNFGAGVIAAFLGLTLQNRPETVWFHPETVSEIADIHLTFDAENRWLVRVADICRAAVERFEGLIQVAMTDLGGNLDILSSFRPGALLPMDLCDSPEEVKRLTWEAHDMWWRYFDALNEVLQPVNPGYTAWTPIYSQEPYYMLQCDFCYMIGPEMFDEFVKPELAASCRRLTNPFYHLDGTGQLPHLDSLLEIPELKGVQWVPGAAGRPGITGWPEVYRKIHEAGKLIQIFTGQDEKGLAALDIIADQIGTAKGIIMIGGVGPEQEGELAECLKKYGAE